MIDSMFAPIERDCEATGCGRPATYSNEGDFVCSAHLRDDRSFRALDD